MTKKEHMHTNQLLWARKIIGKIAANIPARVCFFSASVRYNLDIFKRFWYYANEVE